MRTWTSTVLAATGALLLGAPVAAAHEGDPNYLSQVNRVTPAVDGVTVTVLNRDDRLLLENRSGETVIVEGYKDEPYARIEADGTVLVNTDSQAHYLNQERDGKVAAPPEADSEGAPRWEEVSRSGRFEWHDHRMHWMSSDDPEAVKDKDVRTKVFDWDVPITVGGRRGAITGTLFWTPSSSSDVPIVPIALFTGAGIALSLAVLVIRRRRGAFAEAREAW